MSQIITAIDSNHAKQLSQQCRQHKIRRIYRGLYTDDLQTSIADIVRRHWLEIVALIVPKGILSHRTAIDLKPIYHQGANIAFVTSSYHKTIQLPGLTISVQKGNTDLYTEQVLPQIARSNRERMLLENLSPTHNTTYKEIKTIGIEGVENYLAKEMRLRNETHLNKIRDNAKIVAANLGLNAPYKKLNAIISALLSTHPDNEPLSSDYAKAVAKQEPYDISRIHLFENLSLYLKRCHFLKRPYRYNKQSFKNLTFFESYFSNFIEGTEFIIDEAEDIVFKGIEINHRHADSHDVLANFTLSHDFTEMTATAKTAKEFLSLLQERHAYLMQARPEKNPGKFKTRANKVGNTFFVMPDDVIGTLCRGFELYQILNDGLEKALFMQFLISEVHPFDDGNGRLSRIMMNAECVKNDIFKIIIPSVHRDNYLNGLRLASRDHNFQTYCKVVDQAQAYSASINWADYGEARKKIENDDANLTADEGLATFNRALRQLALSDFAI